MGELLHNFGVDWKLLLAQVVNFAILFTLLRIFAYKPVLAMLRRRREEIEKGFAMRDEAEKTLGEVEELRTATSAAAHEEALGIVGLAQEEALRRKEEIVKEAVSRGDVLLAEAKRAADKEHEKMSEAVAGEAQDLVREALERVLGELPPGERDRELIRQAVAAVRAAKNA